MTVHNYFLNNVKSKFHAQTYYSKIPTYLCMNLFRKLIHIFGLITYMCFLNFTFFWFFCTVHFLSTSVSWSLFVKICSPFKFIILCLCCLHLSSSIIWWVSFHYSIYSVWNSRSVPKKVIPTLSNRLFSNIRIQSVRMYRTSFENWRLFFISVSVFSFFFIFFFKLGLEHIALELCSCFIIFSC